MGYMATLHTSGQILKCATFFIFFLTQNFNFSFSLSISLQHTHTLSLSTKCGNKWATSIGKNENLLKLKWWRTKFFYNNSWTFCWHFDKNFRNRFETNDYEEILMFSLLNFFHATQQLRTFLFITFCSVHLSSIMNVQ